MKCPKCQADNPDDTLFCGKCGAKLKAEEEAPASLTKTIETPTEELTRGSVIADRYEIIEELGKGGMGKVFRVEDKKIKEEVALKLIKPEIAADKKTIERFSNELKFARKIAHRNVCKMYDLGEEEGTYYITMEYVPGEDLKSFIRRSRQLNVGTAISLAKQVSEGLSEAHRLGVVHRDLKPQNVMIDKEGNARIMDFGVARSVTGKGITGAGVMIGTPEYMSPEQVEGKEADQRSDIYSLGIMLYEMLTGRVPFEGDTAFAIGIKQKSESPQDPREFNSQISDDLSRVILKCLEKDKEKRFQSASEVRSELSRIEQGIPTTERVIPKKEPITSKEITVTLSMKKLLIPALVVIALIVAAIIVIMQLLPQKEAIPVSTDKPSLAVVYFVNNTGNMNLDHWRSALPEWLITDLSQSKYIKVLAGDRILNILRKLDLLKARSYDSEDLEKVANEGAVSYILKGSFSKAGDTFRIDYALQNIPTDETVGTDYVTGMGEESFPSMVDELTRKIKTNLHLSQDTIARDIDEDVGTITTTSPEAYKYYSEGRKFHFSGEYRQSIPFMQKAIEIDPSFAMAFRSLAMSYSNLGYETEKKKYIRKAFELTDKLSERERYLIQGDYYREEMMYDKAIQAYDELLKLYPDDHTGNNNSAIIYMNLEDWDKAIERYTAAVEDKDPSTQSHIGLGGAYAYKGMYDECEAVFKSFLQNISENINIRFYLAATYVIQEKYNLAQAVADEASSLFPGNPTSYQIQGMVNLFKGDLLKAEKEFQKLLEIEYPMIQVRGRISLSNLYLLQGRYEKAESQLEKGLELAEQLEETETQASIYLFQSYNDYALGHPERALEEVKKAWKFLSDLEILPFQIYTVFVKGLVYIETQAMDEAENAAEEIKGLVDKSMNKNLIRYHDNLKGQIELEKGNPSRAVESLNQSVSSLPGQGSMNDDHALLIDPLARAHFKAGELEQARQVYERITHLTWGRSFFGNLYAKSFYMLGKIYEKQGNTDKAIENYEKFLELWKNADPGIAEVEDAKKRQESLKNIM